MRYVAWIAKPLSRGRDSLAIADSLPECIAKAKQQWMKCNHKWIPSDRVILITKGRYQVPIATFNPWPTPETPNKGQTMKTQHAAGPAWKKHLTQHENGIQIMTDYCTPNGLGQRIATTNGCNHANARLIAAAPDTARQRDELLEELKSLVEQLDGIGIPDWHGAEGLNMEPARAAIADAEK